MRYYSESTRLMAVGLVPNGARSNYNCLEDYLDKKMYMISTPKFPRHVGSRSIDELCRIAALQNAWHSTQSLVIYQRYT